MFWIMLGKRRESQAAHPPNGHCRGIQNTIHGVGVLAKKWFFELFKDFF
jgi:hypothetical protein